MCRSHTRPCAGALAVDHQHFLEEAWQRHPSPAAKEDKPRHVDKAQQDIAFVVTPFVHKRETLATGKWIPPLRKRTPSCPSWYPFLEGLCAPLISPPYNSDKQE